MRKNLIYRSSSAKGSDSELILVKREPEMSPGWFQRQNSNPRNCANPHTGQSPGGVPIARNMVSNQSLLQKKRTGLPPRPTVVGRLRNENLKPCQPGNPSQEIRLPAGGLPNTNTSASFNQEANLRPKGDEQLNLSSEPIIVGLPEHLMYKNLLQEYTQKLRLPFPSYHTINEGFPHSPSFKSIVLVGEATYGSRQKFRHRKEAEQDAAKHALECIKERTKAEPLPNLEKDSKLWKSILQEFAVKTGQGAPKYETNQAEKLRPVFFSLVIFKGETYKGEVSKSKKDAEQLAAHAAIQSLLGQNSEAFCQIVNSKTSIHKTIDKIKFKSLGIEQNNLSDKNSEGSSWCQVTDAPAAKSLKEPVIHVSQTKRKNDEIGEMIEQKKQKHEYRIGN